MFTWLHLVHVFSHYLQPRKIQRVFDVLGQTKSRKRTFVSPCKRRKLQKNVERMTRNRRQMFEHFKVINLNLFTQFLSFLFFDRFLTLHVCPKQFFVCVLVFTFYVIIDLLHLLICESLTTQSNVFCIYPLYAAEHVVGNLKLLPERKDNKKMAKWGHELYIKHKS